MFVYTLVYIFVAIPIVVDKPSNEHFKFWRVSLNIGFHYSN